MKLCAIVGARPQFIKAAAVSRAIAKVPGLEEVIVHTGQHYDSNMSAQFFEELLIKEPKYHLNVGSASHGKQTGEMLSRIEEVLLQEKPDWVLVYGDTNSTLAGALAAVKLHFRVAHVEAGLRSFNRKMPEEINRIMADHVSKLLFVPTLAAHKQLLKEGMSEDSIVNVGDVMFDATLFYNEFNAKRTTLLEEWGLQLKSYVLVTLHRAENTDEVKRLHHICEALMELGEQYTVILPLHPRTRAALIAHHLLNKLNARIRLTEPIGFLDMLAFEQHAACIITDSGGVQKEAYFNQVPCITLRNETEWVELVEAGWNQLCSPDEAFSLLDKMRALPNQARDKHTRLYGDGDASGKIVQALLE